MTAPVGTHSFTTKESKLSEENHVLWISQVINELGEGWSIEYSMTIEDLMEGRKPFYGLNAKGQSQSYVSDGGFIFYKGRFVGVAENKFQSATQNACERVGRYLFSFIKPEQMFVSCAGDGFKLVHGGGSTGPLIDLMRYSGVTVTENVNEEKEFKRIFKEWITNLVK